MSSVKISYSLALLLLLALQFSFIYSKTIQPSYCSHSFNCKVQVETNWIWTLDPLKACRPYLSECLFRLANCDLYFKTGKTLRVVQEKECLSSKCFDDCNKEWKENICAFPKAKTNPCYFANTCALSNYLCKTRSYPFNKVTYFQESCGNHASKCLA